MIENLQIVNIGHYVNRTGTLFLHSLLDNHPQILSIPGVINLDSILQNRIDNANQALEYFERENPKFFDTSSFIITDKNNSQLFCLGENKTDKILTNKDLFKSSFLNFLKKNNNISKKNIILGIYYAYSQAHKIKLNDKKILLLHPHEQDICIKFNQIFPLSKFLVPIRNPIKVYYSLIETRRAKCNIRRQNYFPRGSLVELINGLRNFRKNNFNMMVIRLEDLGNNTEKEVKKICDYININFDTNLLLSTFGGFKYWGNTINLQRNRYEEKDYDSFSQANKTDLTILRTLNKGIIEEFYKDEDIYTKKKCSLYKLFLPLQDELIYLKSFSFKYFFSYLKFFLYYLPKRLFLIFKLK